MAMTDPGSLGFNLAAFLAQWNAALEDPSRYGLKGTPTRSGATFTWAPQGATNTILLGVLNDDGTIRAIDAASVAGTVKDDIGRTMAQLEGTVIWSTLGRAANPRLTRDEGFAVLTQIGYRGGSSKFGLLDPAVLDLKGVRYYMMEGDATRNFIARQAN